MVSFRCSLCLQALYGADHSRVMRRIPDLTGKFFPTRSGTDGLRDMVEENIYLSLAVRVLGNISTMLILLPVYLG